MSNNEQLHDSHNVKAIELLLRRVIKNPDGKIVFDSGDQPSNSFVLGFLDVLSPFFDSEYSVGSTTEQVTDTGNVARTIGTISSINKSLAMRCPANSAVYGLVVGTGNTAEANTDYALATQIAHGAGAGQFTHGACAITHASVVAGNVDLIVTRSFVNGSGGQIVVAEIGIYVATTDTVPGQKNICIIRDVLAATDTVNNGQTYTVTYTLRTTV